MTSTGAMPKSRRDAGSVGGEAEPYNKGRGEGQSDADACNAGKPSKMVEQLAKHSAADKATKEITSKVRAAGNPAVCSRRPPDKAGGAGLRKEGADPNQHHPGEDVRKVR